MVITQAWMGFGLLKEKAKHPKFDGNANTRA